MLLLDRPSTALRGLPVGQCRSERQLWSARAYHRSSKEHSMSRAGSWPNKALQRTCHKKPWHAAELGRWALNMEFYMQKVVIIILISALFGCATYQPPSIPESAGAIISPPEKKWGDQVYIDKIDGLPPSSASAFQLHLFSDPVLLAPGKHTMRVRVRIGISEGLIDLWIVAKAGRTYNIRKTSVGYTFTAWFEDSVTGEKVGGIEPPRDSRRLLHLRRWSHD